MSVVRTASRPCPVPLKHLDAGKVKKGLTRYAIGCILLAELSVQRALKYVAPSDDKQIAKSSTPIVERDCLRTNYEGAAPPDFGGGRAVSIGGAE